MAYEVYPEKYVTTQGETWDTISQDFYGTPYKIKELVRCNRKYADILVFEAGTELNIPILEGELSTTLAPWKRGA